MGALTKVKIDTALVLAAGPGTRVWPYAEIRPKVMIPVANRPLVSHQVDSLRNLGVERIVIAAGPFHEQIRHYFRHASDVVVVNVGETTGTAATLAALDSDVQAGLVLVVHGDSLVSAKDLQRLVDQVTQPEDLAALVAPLGDESCHDWVCCTMTDGKVTEILGHPRDGVSHRFAAFVLPRSFWPYLSNNSGIFTNVQVGMMPPVEGYLEMSLVDWMTDERAILAVETADAFFDVDKPWHILMANAHMTDLACRDLRGHELSSGASIHPTASVEGYVRLGQNSTIGGNVVVRGNLVVGDNTTIENGAIIHGNTIIGNHCYIGDYCYVSHGVSIGDGCVVSHCAELAGLLMEGVYLYHYMEICGIVGQHTDVGAATVCGTLRFDDWITSHVVKGRREYPRHGSNATYLGDFCRTGVNAIIMPGCKVGTYSVVGPGVILRDDLPSRKIVSVQQDLSIGDWGPERYGW